MCCVVVYSDICTFWYNKMAWVKSKHVLVAVLDFKHCILFACTSWRDHMNNEKKILKKQEIDVSKGMNICTGTSQILYYLDFEEAVKALQ